MMRALSIIAIIALAPILGAGLILLLPSISFNRPRGLGAATKDAGFEMHCATLRHELRWRGIAYGRCVDEHERVSVAEVLRRLEVSR